MNINKPEGLFRNLSCFHRRPRDATTRDEPRIPFHGVLPDKIRNHFIAVIGEFSGTFLFLLLAFSATQVANAASMGADASIKDDSIRQTPNVSSLIYISLAFGFSLAVNVWVFFRISGGLFNPAVTLGVALIGAITWSRAGLLFIAQMLGALAAAGVTSGLFPGTLNVSTGLSGNTSLAQGLFIEMFLTAELIITIFMLAAEKHKGTFIAPLGIGLALFVCHLSGVYFTGGSLNPARSFAPCVVNRAFPRYHWIYWLGPALGALVAVGFYRFIKTLEYETANPGQDFNEQEAAASRISGDHAHATDSVHPNQAHFGGTLNSHNSGQVPGYESRVEHSPTNTSSVLDEKRRRSSAFVIAPEMEAGYVQEDPMGPGLKRSGFHGNARA